MHVYKIGGGSEQKRTCKAGAKTQLYSLPNGIAEPPEQQDQKKDAKVDHRFRSGQKAHGEHHSGNRHHPGPSFLHSDEPGYKGPEKQKDIQRFQHGSPVESNDRKHRIDSQKNGGKVCHWVTVDPAGQDKDWQKHQAAEQSVRNITGFLQVTNGQVNGSCNQREEWWVVCLWLEAPCVTLPRNQASA